MLTKSKRELLRKYKYFISLCDFDDPKIKENILNVILLGEEFNDCQEIAALLLECSVNIKKIEKLIEKYPEFYNQINNSLFPNQVSLGEELNPTIFITNMCDGKENDFIMLHRDTGASSFSRKQNKYYDDVDNPKWCLRPSKVKSDEAVLEYEGQTKIVLSLNKKFAVTAKSTNYTNLVFYPFESATFIFRKEYMDSLNGSEPDIEQCVAYFVWDCLLEDSVVCLASLGFNTSELSDDEATICIMSALAANVMFVNKIKTINNNSLAFSLAFSTATLMNINRKF